MQTDEKLLVEKCKKGNTEAFSSLYDLYSTEAYRTAYLITGRREVSEDAVQETFIYCFKTINSLKKAEVFRSWMYKILVRTAWKVMKRECRHSKRDCIENYENTVPDSSMGVLETVSIRETVNEIYHAVKSLTPVLREVVVLHYYNGMSLADISIVLNCRVGTVKSRLFNARKALSSALKDEFEYNKKFSRIKEDQCNGQNA